jgi:lipopolysaccharide/colanic/teichoic acid biosynthesis glycosyltransferase
MKRAFDYLVAAIGLVLLFPVFAVVSILIKVDSSGPVFFRQERIGKGFRPFLIYKFRTMVEDAARHGTAITIGADPRITRVGRFLRQTKIDELPQLVNVVMGEMSLVGPRPEVAHYVEMFREDYEEILQVRPGITDLASLKYQSESEWLSRFDNPEREYVTHVLPEKIKLAREYVQRTSMIVDLVLILKTVPRLFGAKFKSIY